jgi:saccharopine dehydrogenase-like NADP-dependent oxidoreductase
LRTILAGSACFVSCVGAELNPDLAHLAVSLGSHFCDLGGSDKMLVQELELKQTASERAVWVVPNCGVAPGLVNILCMHGVEQFDNVESARLRVGDIPLDPSPPFNITLPFAAEQLLERYTEPVTLIRDGELVEVSPLSGWESISFSESLGPLEAYHTSGSLSRLPWNLLGKVDFLDFKSITLAGHADTMRFIIGLGLADARDIDLRTHLTYRGLLAKRIERSIDATQKDVLLVRVAITGTKDDRQQTYVTELVERFDEERHLTAMKRSAAVCVSLVAECLITGQITGGGSAPPELIIPKDRFLTALAGREIGVQTRWVEGAADIAHA